MPLGRTFFLKDQWVKNTFRQFIWNIWN